MNSPIIKSNGVLTALLTFTLFSIVSAQTPAAGAQSDIASRVDQLFARFDRPDSPGCALGVIKDGKLIYKRGYGMANLEHDIPISPTTVFNVASASTQFTAMSVLLLARQGKLRLDDDIRKYLPELPAYQAAITIGQLIHHTSGVRDRADLMAIAGRDADEVYKEDDIIELLARQKETNFKPGSRRLFSNSGYALLAAIVKRASGKSLRQIANENIFNPLGMSNTGFQDEGAMIVKNRASDYLYNNEGSFQVTYPPLNANCVVVGACSSKFRIHARKNILPGTDCLGPGDHTVGEPETTIGRDPSGDRDRDRKMQLQTFQTPKFPLHILADGLAYLRLQAPRNCSLPMGVPLDAETVYDTNQPYVRRRIKSFNSHTVSISSPSKLTKM